MSVKVSHDFFGQEVPVALMEMVRQTYIFEGTDPNKIYTVFQAAQKKFQLEPWQKGYFLERMVTLHIIRNEPMESCAKMEELETLAHDHPSPELKLIVSLTQCQLLYYRFCESGDRALLDKLRTSVKICEPTLPNNGTIYDGRFQFLNAYLLAQSGNLGEFGLSIGKGIGIFKNLRVSYLESACHLLALNLLFQNDKQDMLKYLLNNYQVIREYPLVLKAAEELKLKAIIRLNDQNVSYLTKEPLKSLIKSSRKLLRLINEKVDLLQTKINSPLVKS